MDTTIDAAELNTLFIELMRATNTGIDTLLPFVNGLLGSLAIIATVLTFLLGTLREDFSPIPTLISKVLLIGFIAYVVNNWRDLRDVFIRGAIEIGILGGGSSGNADAILNPAEIIIKGGLGFFAVMAQIGTLAGFPSVFANIDDILILTIAAVLILIAFLILAITVFVALAEFYIGTVVALVLIPFSIYRPVSFAAQSALGYVMASGIKIIVLTIIIALADAAFLDRFTELGDEPLPEGIAMGLGFLALALSIVAWSASSMASGLIQGGPALGAGSVFGTAITAGATAGAIGTGVYHAGRGLAAGAGALGRLAAGGGGSSASGTTGRVSGPAPPRLGGPSRPALTGPTAGSASPGPAGDGPPSGLLPGPSDGGSNPSSGGDGQLPVPAGAHVLGGEGSMSAQSEAGTGSAGGRASLGAGAGGAAGATGNHGISTDTLARHVGGRTSDEPWGTRPQSRGTLGRAAALGVAHALYADRSSGGMRGPDFERE